MSESPNEPHSATSTTPRERTSAREFWFQLTTITIGVLIALSFDGVLKWNADRALVAEARARIAREIADNRAELDAHLNGTDAWMAAIGHAAKVVEQALAGSLPENESVNVGFSLAQLNDGAW